MLSTNKQKVVLITGSSSGIGFSSVLLFARSGYIIYASARNLQSEEIKKLKDISQKENLDVRILLLDLSNQDSIKTAINTIIEDHKRLDILINIAGYGYLSAIEDIDIKRFRTHFETNVIGTLYLIQQVIPCMRKRKSGLIINMGSIMGFSTAPLNGPYSVSKYSLESISETLALEVKPFGIDVVVVQSGGFHSKFVDKAVHQEYTKDSPYFKLYKRKDDKRAMTAAGGVTHKKPNVMADVLLKISETKNPKLRYVVGKDALLKKILHTLLPGNLWIKFLRFYYKW